MPALARGQASNCTNPILDIWTTVNGVLVDVYQLEFQVFDMTSPGSPVQVFPVSGRQAVNVAALCPTGNKISTGRYVAVYTPSLTEAIGTHELRWFFKLTNLSPEQTFTEEFEVLPEVVGSGVDGYCSVQDMRDEGVSSLVADDASLQKKIARASAFIERVTGRRFTPTARTVKLDGRGTAALLLNEPIIAITRVTLLSALVNAPGNLDLATLRIYNRHLSQNLLDPDDRDNPRIEFAYSSYPYEARQPGGDPFQTSYFPQGWQNVEVEGVFGYTEPDGTPYGRTPLLIQRACQMLVLRDLYQLANTSAREDLARRWRLLSERTRDQSYTLSSGGTSSSGRAGGPIVGAITGDPEVDLLLVAYKRPPLMGSA